MENLKEKLEKLELKEQQLKEQKRKLIQQHKEKKRKERTRRLIQKGALSEKYFNCENMTEEETKELFIKISELPEVKNLIPNIEKKKE